MTTLSDRPNTALMVIDVQQGVVADAYQRQAVVAKISALVDRARSEGVPIVGPALRRAAGAGKCRLGVRTEDHSAWGAPPPDKVIAHTNLYWQYQAAPGRTAEVRATGDVTFTR